MLRNALLIVSTTSLLAGCEVPVMIAADQNQGKMTGMFEVTFPAMLLVQRSDGVEEVMKGSLKGHASGNSNYSLTGPISGKCIGSYDKKSGQNTLTCENGFSYSENIGQQRAKMSGVNVATGTYKGGSFVGAFGWGNDANESSVRQAIAKYKSTTG